MGCHFILQGIFLTRGSNLCLPRWQVHFLLLSHQGSHHTLSHHVVLQLIQTSTNTEVVMTYYREVKDFFKKQLILPSNLGQVSVPAFLHDGCALWCIWEMLGKELISRFMEERNRALDNYNLKCTLIRILVPFCLLTAYMYIPHCLVFMETSVSVFKLKAAYSTLVQMPSLRVFIVSLIWHVFKCLGILEVYHCCHALYQPSPPHSPLSCRYGVCQGHMSLLRLVSRCWYSCKKVEMKNEYIMLLIPYVIFLDR